MTRRRWTALAVCAVAALGAAGCGSDTTSAQSQTTVGVDTSGGETTPERYSVRVVREIARTPDAFTQGLVFDASGRLWESTGIEGESALRELDPDSGQVLQSIPLPDDEFGEGLSVGPQGLVQLTWTDGAAYRYTTDPLGVDGTFDYDGEGWGLTSDGSHFVMSDGSASLTWRDHDNFDVVRTLPVTLAGQPLDQLNELEWVDGAVLSNVWHSDDIVSIDPTTGEVRAVIDASALWPAHERGPEMTLNGIAHRPGDPSNRLWLTGKYWPTIFVVDLVEG